MNYIQQQLSRINVKQEKKESNENKEESSLTKAMREADEKFKKERRNPDRIKTLESIIVTKTSIMESSQRLSKLLKD